MPFVAKVFVPKNCFCHVVQKILFIQTIHYGQDTAQGQLLSWEQLNFFFRTGFRTMAKEHSFPN